MDAYARASSEWNDCIVEAEEFCGEDSTQELWLRADVAIARAKVILSSLTNGGGSAVATDALAKEQLHLAQVAIETYAVENGGSYMGASASALREIDPSVPRDLAVDSTADTYRISILSDSGSSFAIANNSGSLSYPCSQSGKGSCPASGAWE